MATTAQPGGPVVIDLQAVQSADHRGRGIARYSYDLAVALVAARPELVGSILLSRKLAPPGDLGPLVPSGKLVYDDDPRTFGSEARIFHSLSPFELQTPLDQIWPREASRRGLLLAVTAYDIIPELLAHHYLRHPGPRLRYRTRLELLRAADHVMAISAAAGADVAARLEIPPERITVVGTGTSPRFHPPAEREIAKVAATSAVPGLESDFILYPGGTDYRKNIESLIRAYATLSPEQRRRWQLVVACEMSGQPHAHYSYVSRTLGIEDRLLLTGHITDEALVLLYQSAGVVVVPSLAEGYGLPVAEAMACGAPTIASDIPALAELLPADQLFDPTDLRSITAALERVIHDPDWRAELASRAGRPATTWGEVAERVAGTYELMLERQRESIRIGHDWRRRRRIAFVTPMPPAPTGVSHHSYRLAEELAARGDLDLDIFIDGLDREPYQAVVPAGVEQFPVSALEPIEALRGGYDKVVYALGNSDSHTGALAQLRRRPGVVLAHDVRMTNLYYFGSHDQQAVPDGLKGSLRRIYGGLLPESVAADGRVSLDDEAQHGVLMIREVIDLAEQVLVSSEAALGLVALDARPGAMAKVEVLHFSADPPRPARSGFEDRPGASDVVLGGDDPVLVAFGIMHPIRQPERLLEAFAIVRRRVPNCRLAYVGPAPEYLAQRVWRRAEALDLAEALIMTEQVSTEVFRRWMRRATAAVQLRDSWNGEASGTVGECIVAGVPLVVSDVGWMHEIPDGCAVKVDPGLTPPEFGEQLCNLVEDPARRRAMLEAQRRHAPYLSFARGADDLVKLLFPEG